MLLTTTTFECTEATGPKFWVAWTAPGPNLTNQQYSYITPSYVVSTGQQNLEVYDTEEELSARVDELKGEVGWYMNPENRIPHPPNPNVWENEDLEP
jgi:hypothetical protein